MTYTFIPPASPVPGWSSGDVCRLIMATRSTQASSRLGRPATGVTTTRGGANRAQHRQGVSDSRRRPTPTAEGSVARTAYDGRRRPTPTPSEAGSRSSGHWTSTRGRPASAGGRSTARTRPPRRRRAPPGGQPHLRHPGQREQPERQVDVPLDAADREEPGHQGQGERRDDESLAGHPGLRHRPAEGEQPEHAVGAVHVVAGHADEVVARREQHQGEHHRRGERVPPGRPVHSRHGERARPAPAPPVQASMNQ